MRGLLNSHSHVTKEHRIDADGTSAAGIVSTFWRMLDFGHLLKMPDLASQLCYIWNKQPKRGAGAAPKSKAQTNSNDTGRLLD
jgi:hypothetical protein